MLKVSANVEKLSFETQNFVASFAAVTDFLQLCFSALGLKVNLDFVCHVIHPTCSQWRHQNFFFFFGGGGQNAKKLPKND